MPQLTIYLDENTEGRARAAAEADGVSLSKWVAGVIRKRTADDWPQEVLDLAGAWPDFPSVEELRTYQSEDVPRESF